MVWASPDPHHGPEGTDAESAQWREVSKGLTCCCWANSQYGQVTWDLPATVKAEEPERTPGLYARLTATLQRGWQRKD